MLVLSLFPGIGLLDQAFEEEGFAVVRGPDLLWGGDVRLFHPPSGRFEGIIGGPPCQAFSQINQAARKGMQKLAANLIPEFERCVSEAQPDWFVMENVPQAPEPVVPGYCVSSTVANNRWFGEVQNRVRRFSFGVHDESCLDPAGRRLDLTPWMVALEAADKAGCFTANGSQWDADKGRSRSQRTWSELRRGLRLQGLREDLLDDCPLTVEGAIRAVGNGVPLPLGRVVARAVRRALERTSVASAG
jgi:DNA (cytosine-5)-methyltransferase 1